MGTLTLIGIIIVSLLAGMESVMDEFEFHQPILACSLIGIVDGWRKTCFRSNRNRPHRHAGARCNVACTLHLSAQATLLEYLLRNGTVSQAAPYSMSLPSQQSLQLRVKIIEAERR